MAQIRLYFDGDRTGPLFERSVFRQGERVREAARGAALDATKEIRSRAAADIASAGNFGQRWTEGLQAQITEGGGSIRVAISHDVPYFHVFQNGAVIHGKPLLWIPLSFAGVPKGLWARDYPTPLFRVDRGGKAPLLFSWKPGTKEPPEPVYFGKESVTIPKKFHVVEIVRDVARRLREFYLQRFNASE